MKTKDIMAIAAAFLVLIGVIAFMVLGGHKKETKTEVKSDNIPIYGFTESALVTKEMDTGITRVDDPDFATILKGDTFFITAYNDVSYTEEGTKAWGQLSDNEWILYAGEPEKDLYLYIEGIKSITQAQTVVIGLEIDQKGYIGITEGGYQAGAFSVGDVPYYIASYYTVDGTSCAYMTSDKEKVPAGLQLIERGVLTMIDDASVLEGTGDEDEDYIPISDPRMDMLQKEYRENAKYVDMKVKQHYDKMRLLFTCANFKKIDEIYVVNELTSEIYYPDENEEHNDSECVFVIPDVEAGTTLRFVMYSDSPLAKPEVAALEYDESPTVMTRRYIEDMVSEDGLSEVMEITEDTDTLEQP